ncbi:hypothetical protein LA080_002944 [Diaporthe eres]|nr:hypothetical protein LA080_002944 [Diaporthe eres]
MEADQDLSSSWLDLVDWTLLDADNWVDGDFGGTSNEVLTDDFDFPGFDGQLFEAKATSRTAHKGPNLGFWTVPARYQITRYPGHLKLGILDEVAVSARRFCSQADALLFPCSREFKCDVDQPCRACPRRGGQTAWQLIGCQRGRLEMQIKICLRGSSHCPIPLRELQTSINTTLATATTSLIANEEAKREMCSGCSECLHFLKYPTYAHDRYDFRKVFIRLVWELTDNPYTILPFDMGSISRIRELLKAASRYAAEVGDVDKLIITSLACLQPCLELWRLHSHGLVYRGMHGSCITTREEGCHFKPFADLQHSIQQYTSELSKVFFRKKALQSDRRWWLSVFYSFLIQSPVRQTLVMIQAETNSGPLVKDSGPTQCTQYCYTALNIFDAASAGWDPITSDEDLEYLLSGSDIDQKVARHIKVAREAIHRDRMGNEIHDSFEFLKNMFGMDVSARVRRRISTRRISSKGSTAAMTPQPALCVPSASQTPHFSDSEHASSDHIKNHDSDTESSIPPPLPPPRFVPAEEWESLRGYKSGTNKRRATSPPQEDGERRLSTDNFPLFLSTADDTSDRANSISSINSFSSINAAYGTLALDSPGSGQSQRLMSSSPHSTKPDNTQQPGKPPAISAHELIRRRSAMPGTNAAGKVQGFYMCDCCPKKPKKFSTREELDAHEAEKPYECAYCGNRFRDKDEAERHTNSLHTRSHSWSCSALNSYDRAFLDSKSRQGQADTCGFCGVDFDRTGSTKYARYPSDDDWDKRIAHLQDHHKFRECNLSKKFYRADHFRMHLKHSHGALAGDWMRYLVERVMQEETPDDYQQSSGRTFGRG